MTKRSETKGSELPKQYKLITPVFFELGSFIRVNVRETNVRQLSIYTISAVC